MAADETKQPSKQRVVEMVKASKNWKGAYQADYNCPKCRAPLVSLDDTLLATETCPNCNAAFIFGPGVQAGYRIHEATVEEKAAEKRRQAGERKRIEDEKARAAEVARLQQAEEDREYDQRKTAEQKQYQLERSRKIAARRTNLKGVENGIGGLVALSFIGSLAIVFLGVVGLMAAPGIEGMTVIIGGVTSLVSLLLVYGLFRCLFAIHQLLTDISEKLDEKGSSRVREDSLGAP